LDVFPFHMCDGCRHILALGLAGWRFTLRCQMALSQPTHSITSGSQLPQTSADHLVSLQERLSTTQNFESCEKATELNLPLWPSSVCWRPPVLVSPILTVSAHDADASSFESWNLEDGWYVRLFCRICTCWGKSLILNNTGCSAIRRGSKGLIMFLIVVVGTRRPLLKIYWSKVVSVG